MFVLYVCMYACMYACMYVYFKRYPRINKFVYMNTMKRFYMCMSQWCIQAYVYEYICMYVCMYVCEKENVHLRR